MAKDKDKHPSWFKMKLERRELIKQLSPETAVNVLLACWDFLETGEKPVGLSPTTLGSCKASAIFSTMANLCSKAGVS